MNTRILRMTHRSTLFPIGLRQVEGLGQLQPVQFSTRDGVVRFSCEGMAGDRCCIWKYPLPNQKAQAKAAFAELERCKALGIETPAARHWREYQEGRAHA